MILEWREHEKEHNYILLVEKGKIEEKKTKGTIGRKKEARNEGGIDRKSVV